MSASDYIFKSSPKFLQVHSTYRAFSDAIGQEIEYLKTQQVDAARQALISKCSPDALAVHGFHYHIPPIPSETSEQYRSRLLNYITTASQYSIGSVKQIFDTLAHFSLSGVVIRSRTSSAANTSFYYDSFSTISQTANAFIGESDADLISPDGYPVWNTIWIIAHPTRADWTPQFSTRNALIASHSTNTSYIATGKASGLNARQVDLQAMSTEMSRVIPIHITNWSFSVIVDSNSSLLGWGNPSPASYPFVSSSNTYRFH